jgi:hypothetical protein
MTAHQRHKSDGEFTHLDGTPHWHQIEIWKLGPASLAGPATVALNHKRGQPRSYVNTQRTQDTSNAEVVLHVVIPVTSGQQG